MSRNPLIEHPHIYKKGKILNFKKLNEGLEKKDRRYVFSSIGNSIPDIRNHCNNINQIVGRNWLGIHKLISYFGIAKDPSEKLSKNPSNFNHFWDKLREGEGRNDLKEILRNLKDQKNRLNDLEKKIDGIKPTEPILSKQEVVDLREQLKEIRGYLRDLLGKNE